MDITSLIVNYEFEKTLGINFLAGRSYIKHADPDSVRIMALDEIVLNETAVNRLGIASPEEAIGQSLVNPTPGRPDVDGVRRSAPGFPPMTIVGVVEDFHMESLHRPVGPLMLSLMNLAGGHAAVRLDEQNISRGLEAIEDAWTSIYPDYPLAYSFLDQDFERLHLAEQRTGKLIGIFSCLAIFIACLGLLGLAAFTTEQRTKEIGIHKVLGAPVPHIVFMLSKDFLKLVLIAMPVAWAVSYWAMNIWLQNFSYRIDIDLWWFPIAGILALGIALVTVGLRTFTAALVNPVETLRYE